MYIKDKFHKVNAKRKQSLCAISREKIICVDFEK